ncbi:hypothetical protein J3L18_28510 [Mucilaginibacter gossypii]|uniref:hypothetical protein n=1 Tax=Mucilaginibacter gossypii TaxID=551996 RepID=UPI000DCCA8BE|nr:MULTISPECIES: hypothetical protein [Mucilaginibacter]QTE37009.1 hypothetical protein J3L18_28510 [Mucilaginibacter gossypii]RAV49893.1 hypothetical protein DIU36_27080 [Mucilaginibacter rubeus]
MNPSIRKVFNEKFSTGKYSQFLDKLNSDLKEPVPFRVAETPVFLTADFRDKLISAGNDIVDTILKPNFKELTERAIPDFWRVSNENDHPHFIALDFGICKDEQGNIVPKLIELQGFPSLYSFQVHLGDTYQEVYDIPADETIFFGGLKEESYLDLLKKTILGPYQSDEVVLMDVNAPEQKTAVDFYLTQKYIGTPVVSLSDLIQDGKKLYYMAGDQKKLIKRIYNRLIFDEIAGDPDIFTTVADIRQPLEVEWITHPNWFYRISKFTMPFLTGDYIPQTQFLHQLKQIPANLENYVLKPLFSFAGQGVIIDISKEDIETITDPENWILQEKVNYEPVVQSPEGGVKAEIRLLYLWPDGDKKPTLATNLARLSRGKMIGVRYNKDYNWVGGTVAFMPR